MFENNRKVSFNIASEASYIYILSGQKFIKNAKKMVHFSKFLEPEAYGKIVLQNMSLWKGQKNTGKC